MARKLKATTGIERIEIVNEFDEPIGVYAFKPANAGRIFSKMMEKTKELEEMAEGLNKIPEDTDPDKQALEFVKVYQEAEKKIINWFDEVFEANSYEGFFKDTSPLALIKGDFFFVQILNILSDFIKDEVTKEPDEKTKKMNDYLAPYGA